MGLTKEKKRKKKGHNSKNMWYVSIQIKTPEKKKIKDILVTKSPWN